MSTMTEPRNETPTAGKEKDLRQEVQDLKHQLELQTATQAGVDATQVATTAGAQATQAAAHAGTWSTMSPEAPDSLSACSSPSPWSPSARKTARSGRPSGGLYLPNQGER